MTTFSELKPDFHFLKKSVDDLKGWKKVNNISLNNPFCIEYKKRKKKLYLVGLTSKEKLNKSIIEKFMTKKIDIVLMKNVEHYLGVNIQDVKVDKFSSYIIDVAKKNFISYHGLESDIIPFFKKMLVKGYTEEDLLVYIFLQT